MNNNNNIALPLKSNTFPFAIVNDIELDLNIK